MTRNSRGLAILLFFACLSPVAMAHSRTWFVAADGSGDAITVDAAIDSSVAGDVILVGPGTHVVFDGTLRPSTSLVSEQGPALTTLIPVDPLQAGLVGARSNCVIGGFTLKGGISGSIAITGDNAEVFNNIVVFGGINVGGTAEVHHNLVLQSLFSINIVTSKVVHIYNNIVLGEIVSSFSGCGVATLVNCNLVQGEQECVLAYGNFDADPLFCGIASNYYLRADSPCAPGNHPDGLDCGIIGPLPVACGTVSVEQKSWGAVKALYRQ